MKLLKILIALGVLGALACAGVAAAGLLAPARPADLAVVLGNAVKRDGTPSPRLAARLDSALDCYARQRCARIFVTGGIEPSGADEGAVMRAYLIAHGVPAGRIVVDDGGVDTWASARNASDYMRANGLSSALVVSQYFHVPRAMLALARFGVHDVSGAHPRFRERRDLYSIAREVPALAWYAVRPLPAGAR